jgi:outer membrane protein
MRYHQITKFRRRRRLFLGLLLGLGAVFAQEVLAQTPIVVTSATDEELKAGLPPPQTTALTAKLLTLQDAIALALRNNPNVLNARLQRISDRYALELADYAFQPHIGLTGNVTVQEDKKTGYNAAPDITWDTRIGTHFEAKGSTDLEGNQQTTVSVVQPILKGFGKVNEFSWLDAQDSEIANRQTFKNNIIDMVTDVITGYRTVVADYNNLQVQEKTLKREEETGNQYQLRVKAGKMAPSELLQEQATLANTRLSTMRQRTATDQDYQTLLDTLGLSPASKLKLDTNINFHVYHPPSKEEAIEIALNHNPQYVIQKIQLNETRRTFLLAKDNTRWQLDLSGSVSFANAPGANSIVNTFDSIVTTDKPTAIATLSIPIRDISSRVDLVNARVQLAQAEDDLDQSRRSLIRQVVNALNALSSELEQLDIGEQAVVLQRKNLEAERIKQEYGQTTALNVNIIQDNLLQQELDFINSQINYLNDVTQFQNLLGITLDEWHIEMRY